MAEGHRLRLVVRDVHRGDREVGLELGDVRPHLDAQLGVQVGERLVHQEDLRQPHDRAPHRDALPLAARELARLAVQILREAEQRRDLAHPRLPGALLDPGDLEREADVRLDGQIRVERVALEDHRHVAILRREIGDVARADEDRSRVDLLETGEHAQRRGLARPRRPDEHHQLAVVDVELECVDRRHVGAGIDAGRVLEVNVSHGSPP